MHTCLKSAACEVQEGFLAPRSLLCSSLRALRTYADTFLNIFSSSKYQRCTDRLNTLSGFLGAGSVALEWVGYQVRPFCRPCLSRNTSFQGARILHRKPLFLRDASNTPGSGPDVMWISKGEYDESGSSVLHRWCLWCSPCRRLTFRSNRVSGGVCPRLMMYAYSGGSLAASAGWTTPGVMTPVKDPRQNSFAGFSPLHVRLCTPPKVHTPLVSSMFPERADPDAGFFLASRQCLSPLCCCSSQGVLTAT